MDPIPMEIDAPLLPSRKRKRFSLMSPPDDENRDEGERKKQRVQELLTASELLLAVVGADVVVDVVPGLLQVTPEEDEEALPAAEDVGVFLAAPLPAPSEIASNSPPSEIASNSPPVGGSSSRESVMAGESPGSSTRSNATSTRYGGTETKNSRN